MIDLILSKAFFANVFSSGVDLHGEGGCDDSFREYFVFAVGLYRYYESSSKEYI